MVAIVDGLKTFLATSLFGKEIFFFFERVLLIPCLNFDGTIDPD